MRTGWAAILLALCATGCVAQEASPFWWHTALEHGQLNVWMVRRTTNTEKLLIAQQKLSAQLGPTKISEERTLSDFGQPSSTVGQTAGSYGQTSGSFGATASNTGQTAGSAGKSPSELGTSASNAGQVSSSYGQTAGSFGQSAGSYGVASSDSNKLAPARPHPWDEQQEAIARGALGVGWGRNMHYTDVTDFELKEKLKSVRGTAAYPDVIVGTEWLPWWPQSGLGVAMLGEGPWLEQGAHWQKNEIYQPGTIDLLRDAPHPEEARAFWLWITGSGDLGCPGDCRQGFGAATDDPVRVAKAALLDMLGGLPLGELADKEAAEYDAAAAQRLVLAAYGDAVTGSSPEVRVDALSAFTRGSLAEVMLRAEVSSPDAFGVFNSTVVLRRSTNGAWKVLQLSPNLIPEHTKGVYDSLASAARGQAGDGAPLQPVSVATPQEGDARPFPVDLWWDNNGQARLEIVEWEMGGKAGPGTQLMVTHDTDSRTQTRVPATFLRSGASYRIRVWSVASGGRLVMTPWRSFVVR